MKENLKPCVYKLWETLTRCNRVLFVERSGELPVTGEVKDLRSGAEGKPSLNRAE